MLLTPQTVTEWLSKFPQTREEWAAADREALIENVEEMLNSSDEDGVEHLAQRLIALEDIPEEDPVFRRMWSAVHRHLAGGTVIDSASERTTTEVEWTSDDEAIIGALLTILRERSAEAINETLDRFESKLKVHEATAVVNSVEVMRLGMALFRVRLLGMILNSEIGKEELCVRIDGLKRRIYGIFARRFAEEEGREDPTAAVGSPERPVALASATPSEPAAAEATSNPVDNPPASLGGVMEHRRSQWKAWLVGAGLLLAGSGGVYIQVTREEGQTFGDRIEEIAEAGEQWVKQWGEPLEKAKRKKRLPKRKNKSTDF